MSYKKGVKPTAIGKWIDHICETLKITQGQLAEALRVGQTDISKWRTGVHKPNTITVRFWEMFACNPEPVYKWLMSNKTVDDIIQNLPQSVPTIVQESQPKKMKEIIIKVSIEEVGL